MDARAEFGRQCDLGFGWQAGSKRLRQKAAGSGDSGDNSGAGKPRKRGDVDSRRKEDFSGSIRPATESVCKDIVPNYILKVSEQRLVNANTIARRFETSLDSTCLFHLSILLGADIKPPQCVEDAMFPIVSRAHLYTVSDESVKVGGFRMRIHELLFNGKKIDTIVRNVNLRDLLMDSTFGGIFIICSRREFERVGGLDFFVSRSSEFFKALREEEEEGLDIITCVIDEQPSLSKFME